ncbi:MAG: alpha/beta hydrolase [candidate division Zixibacteria bacterium]
MKKCFAFFLIVLLCGNIAVAQSNQNIIGTWNGKLSVQEVTLRLTFHICDTSGTLTATMDSPDQGAYGIPMDSCVYEEGNIRITNTQIMGVYTGKLSDDKNSLTGTWVQGGMSMELNLERGEKVTISRPQEPKPPYPYLEEEISYLNEIGGSSLAGTLSKPKTGGPFPTVLLITGSGMQDRDEMVFGHRPFWVLADHLTRNGIAVLRVDDRGAGKSTGEVMTATSKDFAGDVKAGVEYLKSRDDVDKNKIGLIGHSEGGMIAPMIASESDDIAFIVLLAGPGVPGHEILTRQAIDIMKLDGKSEEEVALYGDLQKKILGVIVKDISNEEAVIEMKQIFKSWEEALPPEISQDLDSTMIFQMQQSFEQALLPWMRYFVAYDPRPALQKTKCPVLAINGEKDVQVYARDNLSAIEKALKEGGNSNYRIEELPDLNHLFQTCKTGAVSEYSEIEETFSPIALNIISDWIHKNIK